MSNQSIIDKLLKNNDEISKTYKPGSLLADLPPTSLPKLFIVTCCDNRIDPPTLLGLEPWEAIVIRGAAGRITPHLQNILFLDHFLQGSTKEIMIIHHTDCSASMQDNSVVREELKKRAPGQSGEIDGLVFPGYEGLEQSVRDDVEFVRSNELVKKELREGTRGFVLDVLTGKVRGVA